jgi:hypothetical protein
MSSFYVSDEKTHGILEAMLKSLQKTDASLSRIEALRNSDAFGTVAQPITDEPSELREALEAAVQAWEPLLADADLSAGENPAWLAIQKAKSILAKYPKQP